MTHPTLADVISGKRAVHVVDRDASHIAFFADRPAQPGHIVVATTRVVDAVLDLDADSHAALWRFVHQIARRMREQLPCRRVCVSVIGWAVRHAHVHLIPTDHPGQVPGLDGEALSDEVMQALVARMQPDGV